MNQSEIISILTVAADFVLLAINGDGVIESANPAVRKIFKKQEGEMEGKPLSEFIPELEILSQNEFTPVEARGGMSFMDDDDVETSNCMYLEYLAYLEESHHYETKVVIDNDMRWFELATYKLLFNDKIFFTVIINDISRRKKNENEIKELNENLEAKVNERTSQIKNVVSSCGNELEHVNQNYQSMKDKQMDILEGLEQKVLEATGTLNEEQSTNVRGVFQSHIQRAMELFCEDQITDQKFLLTIVSLKELFETSKDKSDTLRPGEMGSSNDHDVDDLLDSLGI